MKSGNNPNPATLFAAPVTPSRLYPRQKYLIPIESWLKSSIDRDISQDMSRMGINDMKGIFRKKPIKAKDLIVPDKPKFRYRWFAKEYINPQEIICSEPIRILLGNDFAPKYRIVMKDGVPEFTISRLLENFTPWLSIAEETINDYYASSLRYLDVTGKLSNFNGMFAVCLLMGKDDIHGGNWGIININGMQYAAALDHDSTLHRGIRFYEILEDNDNRKERFLTNDFIDTCRAVITDFDISKEDIRDEIAACVAELNAANIPDVPSVEDVMDILEFNKNSLLDLSYQLEAELAILEGDADKLRDAILNLDSAYLPSRDDIPIPSVLISMQSFHDGTFEIGDNAVNNFRLLIKVRKWHDCDDIKLIHYDVSGDADVKFNRDVIKSEHDMEIERNLLRVYDEVVEQRAERCEQEVRFKYV